MPLGLATDFTAASFGRVAEADRPRPRVDRGDGAWAAALRAAGRGAEGGRRSGARLGPRPRLVAGDLDAGLLLMAGNLS